MATDQAEMSAERLKEAASHSVRSGEHIREQVRDLTLRALQSRKFDYEGMRDVIEAMTSGVSTGAEQRKGKIKQAVAEALSGLDQAMMKSAQAAQMALQELSVKSREFNDSELRQAVEQMKKLESDFLAIVGRAAESASAGVGAEFRDFVIHAQRVGTDTGAVIAQTMREFSHRIATQMLDAQAAGFEAAREMNLRFAEAASGFLQALAESLRDDQQHRK